MVKRFLFLAFLIVCFASCRSKKIDPLKNNEVEGILKSKKKTYSYNKILSDKDRQYFADALEVDVAEITNKKLYIFIKSWDETTYLYGGEDKSGIDCSALMQRLYENVYNVSLPRTAAEMAFYKKIKLHDPVDNLTEGDLVFFRINEEKVFSHVGVYLKNGKFFAAGSSDGCAISSLKKPYWRKNYKAFGRLRA